MLASGRVSGEPAHRCHSPSAGSVIIAAPRISRGRASGSGSVRISTTAIAASTIGNSTTAEPMSTRRNVSIHCADRARGVEPRAGGDHDGDAQQRQRDAVAAVAGLDIAGAADRAGGGAGALGQHQPARAHAAPDGQPRPTRWPTGCGARRACGGAPRSRPRGTRPANRPLTCSNGHRSGRRSY